MTTTDNLPSIDDTACVAEFLRGNGTIHGVTGEVWHAVASSFEAPGGDADFRPILCGVATGEGIVAPGSTRFQAPTCPECLATVEAQLER